MQILTVAMVLGYTVSMFIFEFLPIGLRDVLNPTEVEDEYIVSDGIKLAKLTSDGVKSIDKLRADVDDIQ